MLLNKNSFVNFYCLYLYIMWFKKDKIKETVKSDDLLEEYKQSKKDIEHMESQYQDYILRSLELDFDAYQSNLEEKWPSFESNTSEFWNLTKAGSWSELKLVKCNESDNIKIDVDYNFDQTELSFTIKRISASIGYDTINLDKDKFKNVIYKYYICTLVKKTNQERENAKDRFQRMTKVLGKSTKRDAMIDKILNNG